MGPAAARRSVRKYLDKLVHRHSPDGPNPPDRISDGATLPPTATEARLAGRTTWMHLEIRGQIGHGGFGQVFCAWDPKLERHVALKLIPSEDATGVREARTLARLRHPNLPVVFGVDDSEGFTGIWMELIQGRTLRQLLSLEGPMSSREAALLATEVSRALAAAHSSGVIHRDVKPENVLREDGGRIVLIDFGLSREIERGDPKEIAGTAAYMAPEVLNGSPPTAESDMYAVGVMLFHLVTGEYPFEGRTFHEIRKSHAHGSVRSVAELRPDLEPTFCGIVDRLLSPSPVDRPTAGKLIGQLTSHQSDSAPLPPKHYSRRQIAVVVTAGLCVIAAALLLARERLTEWMTPLPEREQIAVLADSTGPIQDIALSDSLAESLASQLARLEKLDSRLLIIPTADLRRDKVATPEDAAKRFNANLTLRVSTSSRAGKTSLDLRLIEAAKHRDLRTRNIVLDGSEAHLLPARAFELAVSMIGVGRAASPQPPDAHTTNSEAYRLVEEGRYLTSRNSAADLDKALDTLQRALAADPHYAAAYAAIATAYAHKYYRYTKDAQALDLSLTNANRALELNNRIAPPYIARARVNTLLGRVDDALADVSVALTLDPENPDARLLRAECLQRQNRIGDAEKAYIELSTLRPNYWLVHNRLGALYVQQARYEEAVKAFRKVTQIVPNSPAGFKNLGAVYVSMGRNTEAADALEKSLAIEQTPEAYTNLGIVYTRERRFADAVKSYERATKLRPADHRYWRNLGDVLSLLPDRKADAQAAWRTALRLSNQELTIDSHNTQAAVSSALYYAKLNEREEALKYANRADVKNSSDVNVQFKRSLIFELAGNRDSSMEILQMLVQSGFSIDEIRQAPELRELRQDSRFADLTRTAHR